MIKRGLVLFCVSFGIITLISTGCKKNHSGGQKTKVKRITEYLPQTGLGTVDTMVYDFLYTASGFLTEVRMDDSDYMNISMLNAHTVKFQVNQRTPAGVHIDNYTVYAHVNDLKQILSLNTSATNVGALRAIYTGIVTDTFFQPNFFLFESPFGFYFLMEDIHTYDFQFQDGDCIYSTISFLNNQSRLPSGGSYDTNIIHKVYNANVDNVANFIPRQTAYNDLYAGAFYWIDYTFVLGIIGYNYLPPSKHLLQSTYFYSPASEQLLYEYVSDEDMNITQMCTRENSATDLCKTFLFEYY